MSLYKGLQALSVQLHVGEQSSHAVDISHSPSHNEPTNFAKPSTSLHRWNPPRVLSAKSDDAQCNSKQKFINPEYLKIWDDTMNTYKQIHIPNTVETLTEYSIIESVVGVVAEALGLSPSPYRNFSFAQGCTPTFLWFVLGVCSQKVQMAELKNIWR